MLTLTLPWPPKELSPNARQALGMEGKMPWQ